jgi:hypothetical protein
MRKMIQKKLTQLKSTGKFLLDDTLVKPIQYSIKFLGKAVKHAQKLLLDW